MIKIFTSVVIFTLLLMASSVFAGDIFGRHDLSHDRGVVMVKSVEVNRMAFDAIYAPGNGRLLILTDAFADYDSQTQNAVYSEDRLCPDALKMTFQNNGKVVLQEADCAAF
jgi:hypothetical protein